MHAHNDYEQPIPFHAAFTRQAGSIEADVFLQNGELYVAHTRQDIRPDRTLEALYLKPLQATLQKNAGKLYAQGDDTLQLFIDLKTEGTSTMQALARKLAAYPDIIQNPAIRVVISGDVPPASAWEKYPAYFYFDGRPGQRYSPGQASRIALVSDNFRKYTAWNGKGLIVQAEREKIEQLIDSVHRQGQKIRFWATPEGVNAWKTLMRMEVDWLGTDQVTELTHYLLKLPDTEYRNTEKHALYAPKYVNNDQQKKVRNVILLIGDGMGLAQMYAAYTAMSGQLNLFNMLNIGFAKTASSDSYITDSAGGATAIATGRKTNNRFIGVDQAGKPHPAIPDLIHSRGMKSALISSGDITDATPACFYAHQPERSRSEAIAADFLNSPVSILIGGNYDAFAARKDGRNLVSELGRKGYRVASQFAALDTLSSGQFVVLDSKAVVARSKGRGDFLTRSLNKTIATLGQNEKGFFIMAEGAQIDWGGHANQMSYVVQEMLDFDRMVGEAMKFADEDGETLVIVTADHETGGLSLLDGDFEQGYVAGHFSTGDHSAVAVPVFAYGPHSLDFRGVYENTEIFRRSMCRSLGNTTRKPKNR